MKATTADGVAGSTVVTTVSVNSRVTSAVCVSSRSANSRASGNAVNRPNRRLITCRRFSPGNRFKQKCTIRNATVTSTPDTSGIAHANPAPSTAMRAGMLRKISVDEYTVIRAVSSTTPTRPVWIAGSRFAFNGHLLSQTVTSIYRAFCAPCEWRRSQSAAIYAFPLDRLRLRRQPRFSPDRPEPLDLPDSPDPPDPPSLRATPLHGLVTGA